MTLVDNHNHILLAKITDMLASAKANMISEFSITEHISQFKELRESTRFGSVHPSGRVFVSLKEYNNEFAKLDQVTYSGMKINRGLEVDYSPRFANTVRDFVNQEEWDILLCSVHEFADGKDIEKSVRETVDPTAASQKWLEYLRLERMALESDFVPFKVLSHPVRMSRTTKAVPPELDDLLFDLARIARRRNKALELNGRDIDYAPELVRRLAIACSKAGCSVSLGSDAHHPREVFRNMRIANGLVEEFSLRSNGARTYYRDLLHDNTLSHDSD
jgi:HisJ family histidinol phosphate phosphatase